MTSTLKELLAQQEALNKQIEEVRTAAIAGAIEQVRMLVAEFGLTAKDVFTGGAKAAGGKKKLAVQLLSSSAIHFRAILGQVAVKHPVGWTARTGTTIW
jgi:hypothetical protein